MALCVWGGRGCHLRSLKWLNTFILVSFSGVSYSSDAVYLCGFTFLNLTLLICKMGISLCFLCSNCAQTTTQLHSSHMLVKQCSKFSKPGFSNTWTQNFQMFKLVLEKAEEPEIKLPISAGPSKKQESSRKTSISALLTTPKPLTVWITINCGKLWKRWEYQTTWPASWEICMQVMKQQIELDMEQQTGSQ